MAKLIPQFKVVKANGIWVTQNPESLGKFKQDAPDGDYFLSIAPPKRESRSSQQLRYYWGVVVKLHAEAAGYTKEEMHVVYGDVFLRRTMEHKGKLIEYIKSTSDLDTEEMSGYIQLCISEAAQNGVIIPEPDEVVL